MTNRAVENVQRQGPGWMLSVLVAAALIGVCIAAGIRELQHTRERQRLQAKHSALLSDIQRLKNEVGELTVKDERMVNIMRAPQNNAYGWKWRVWIPRGKSFALRAAAGELPAEGFPQAMGVPVLGNSQEGWCEYRIQFNPVDLVWEQTLQVSQSGPAELAGKPSGSDITWPIHEAWWLENPRAATTTSSEGVENSVQVFEPNQTITLLRHRVSKPGQAAQHSSGFLVWLEPKRDR